MDIVTVGFSWGYFFLSLLLTCLPFLWLKKRSLREKLYVLPYVVFFFIYSGVGVSWDNCEKDYLMYYFLWMMFFSFTVMVMMGKKRILSIEGVDASSSFWILKYADFFIALYILMQLITLIASGNIHHLISPPSPDLTSVMDEVSEGGGGVGSGLIYYINHIIFIFYFVSLYKYRNQPGKLFLAIFLPFYFIYANSGYLARSTIMGYLIIYIVAVYFYNPTLRRKIRLLVCFGLPFLLVGLSLYTFIRIGHVVDITPGDAIILLGYQETSYPTQFDLIKKTPFDANLLKDYFEWLITLPLPGFLKDSSKDYFFNAIFTERLYGAPRGSMGFSIALPGVAGEGMFIFGLTWYFLHAIILGAFVGITYRLVKRKEEFFLFLYMGIFMAFHTARAGTVSTYSMYLKDFLVYEIVILLFVNKKKLKIKEKSVQLPNSKENE